MENKIRIESPTQPPTETGAEPAPQTPIEPRERWLLAGALLIGVTFSWMWPASIGAWAYGLFWLVALGVYLAFCGKDVLQNRYAVLLLGGTFVILVRYFFGWEDGFDVFHIFLLPALLMLVLVVVKENPAPQREGVLLRAYVAAWFYEPFAKIGRAFFAAASLGGDRKRLLPVLRGVLLGIPLTFIVASLLMTADAGMESVMRGLFGNLRFGNVLGHLFRTVLITLLFYSLYHHALYGKPRVVREGTASWHPTTIGIVTVMMLLIYTIYITVQFQYLFGARLPADMTYSAYAREGFWQLIEVSCINFLLFGLTERYAKKTAVGTALEALLLLATAMILGSALVRLLLYIGAYGLTMKRILPLWAMTFFAVLTVLCAVRLRRKTMALLRIAAAVLLYWYVVLALVPWDTVIRTYNSGVHGILG